MSMNSNDPLRPNADFPQSPVSGPQLPPMGQQFPQPGFGPQYAPPQAQSPVLGPNSSQPVLGPQTPNPGMPSAFAAPDTPSAPDTAVKAPKTKERANRNRAFIAVISTMSVIIVGLCVVVVLFMTGVIGSSKETESTRKKVAKKTTEKQSQTEKEDPSDPTDTATDTTPAPHHFVEKADEISDEQLEKMIDFATQQFQDEMLAQMPLDVSLDLFNYVGLIISHWSSDPRIGHVIPCFQVQVTDDTGEETVHRNYFWYIGFSEVYKDGYLDTSMTWRLYDSLFFDTWGTGGVLTLDSLREDLYRDGSVIGDETVDSALFEPLPGESRYVEHKREKVTSIEQITPAQLQELKKSAPDFLYPDWDMTGCSLRDMRYLGMVICSNSDDSMTYLLYEVEISYGNQQTDAFYWYVGFPYVYQGGELDMTYYNPTYTTIRGDGWTANGVASFQEMIDTLVNDPNYRKNEITLEPGVEDLMADDG